MKAALAIAVREELGYVDNMRSTCNQCQYCVSDDPDGILSHCTLLATTLG